MTRRPFPKRLLRYLLGGGSLLLVVVLVVGVLSLVAWLTAPGLEERIAPRLASLTGGEASFGTVRLLPGKRLLLVTDGKIALADGTTVSFKRMEMNFRLAPLLAGNVRIDRFRLVDPVVTLPANHSPPAEPAPPVTDARLAPSRIAIPMVTVSVGALHVENARVEGPGLLAGGVDLKGVTEIGPKGLTFSLALTSSAAAPVRLGEGNGAPFLDAVASVAVTAGLERSGRFVMALKGGVSPRPATGRTPVARRLSVRLDVKGSLYTPQLEATGLADLDGRRFLEGKATVEAVGPKVRYEVVLDRLSVELARFINAAGVRGVDVAGTVDAHQLGVAGEAWRNGMASPTARFTGGLSVRLTRLAAAGLTLPSGAGVALDLSGLSTGGGTLKGPLTAEVTAPEARYDGLLLRGLTLSALGAFGEGGRSGPGGGTFDVALAVGELDTPLPLGRVEGDLHLVGDPATGDFTVVEGEVRFPSRKSALALTGDLARYGRERFAVEVGYRAPLALWRPMAVALQGEGVPDFGGFLSGALALEGGLDAEGAPKGSATLKGALARGGVTVGSVAATALEAHYTASCRFDREKGLSDFEARAKVTGGPLALGAAGGEAVALTLNLTSPSPVTAPWVGEMTATLSRFVMAKGGAPLDPRLTLSGEGGNGAGGRVDRFELDLGEKGRLTGAGEYEPASGKVVARLGGDRLDLGAVAALIPPEMAPVNGVAGTLTLAAAAEGNRAADAPWYPFPGAATLDLTLKGGEGNIPESLAFKGADLTLAATLSGKAFTLDAKGGMASLAAPAYNGGAPVSPLVDLSVATDGASVTLQRLVLDAAGDGVVHSLDGALAGLDLAGWSAHGLPGPATLLRKVSGRVNGYTLLSFGADRRPLAPGVTAEGELELVSTVTAVAGKEIAVEGRLLTERLSVDAGERAKVAGLTGRFPFEKRLAYDFGAGEVQVSPPRSVEVRNTGFYADLLAASPPRDGFVIDRIDAGPVTLLSTLFEMTFRQSRFGVDAFRTRLASGGGLAGGMRIEAADGGYLLALTQMFAGIDLAKLAGKGEGSTVDGSMGLLARFNAADTAESLDLTRVEAAFHLTRIDRAGLDGLLAFIDPEGTSPAVTGARTALRFATPVAADIVARYGTLSVEIALQYAPLLGGQTALMPVVRNAPIRGLVNFGVIREMSKKAGALVPVAQAIGASRLVVGDDGAITIR